MNYHLFDLISIVFDLYNEWVENNSRTNHQDLTVYLYVQSIEYFSQETDKNGQIYLCTHVHIFFVNVTFITVPNQQGHMMQQMPMNAPPHHLQQNGPSHMGSAPNHMHPPMGPHGKYLIIIFLTVDFRL